MAHLTPEQHDTLMRPLNGSRVATRTQAGTKLSYLEAWDVKAHMTRIFGFCNWDSIVSDIHLVSAEQDDKKWTICYQATVTVTVRDYLGQTLCTHAEAAVGTSTQGRKGEAMDMALKTAESDAFKRACINLGTQFGLSLYNNGSTEDIIKATLVHPHAVSRPDKAPVSDETPAQVSKESPAEQAPQKPAQDVLDAVAELASYADIDNGRERITAVAKFKAQHDKESLQHTAVIDGQDMTIARYADLVAAGHYSQEKKK